jgi:hypothetical protein
MGILSRQIFLVSSSTKLEISVAMYPGETVFARAKRTHSTERDLPIDLVSRARGADHDRRQRTKVDYAGFGSVIGGLQLREVDNVAAH